MFVKCRRTGLLLLGPENGRGFPIVKDTLQRNKVPIVVLKREEFSQHIPNFNLSSGDGALVDTTAGVLYADKALVAIQVRTTHSAITVHSYAQYRTVAL